MLSLSLSLYIYSIYMFIYFNYLLFHYDFEWLLMEVFGPREDFFLVRKQVFLLFIFIFCIYFFCAFWNVTALIHIHFHCMENNFSILFYSILFYSILFYSVCLFLSLFSIEKKKSHTVCNDMMVSKCPKYGGRESSTPAN